MAFSFGGVDTSSLAGVTATLVSWPSLGGLSLETEDALGRDARYFYGASQSHSEFKFDVIIQGDTPAQVSARRDSFVGAIAPRRGPQPLILETDSDWVWPEVMVSGQIDWERMVWERGTGFTFRAEVSFETVGTAVAVESSPVALPFTATLSYTHSAGNAECFPRVEFPSGASATITIGGFVVAVGATTSGRTNVLDYENFEFYQKNTAGTRLGSIVRHMSHYRRAVIEPGQSVVVSAVGAPSGTRRFYPNSRRT